MNEKKYHILHYYVYDLFHKKILDKVCINTLCITPTIHQNQRLEFRISYKFKLKKSF